MSSKRPDATRAERRNAVRARLDELQADAVLITKRVNVSYLSGFTGSNGQLLVADDDVLFTDGRYEEQSARQSPDLERSIHSGGVSFASVLAPELAKRRVGRLAVEAHDVTLHTARTIRDRAEGLALVEATGVVERLRTVKSPDEIQSLRRAAAIGDAGFQALLGRLREGMSEREAAAELEDAMRRAGSDGVSFDTIVAFGESAAEPHHAPGGRPLKAGDLVKVDFGAIWGGYHSDMTRTIAFGRPSDEQRRIHRLVADAQRAGVAAVRAGVACADVDGAARGVLQAAGYDFGHGTGHGVGLEVHEAPTVRKESVDTLAAGMVVTVEPGLYLPGFAGVRIEDTVVVKEGGCEILTTSARDLVEA